MFLSLPISIFRQRLMQIVHVETAGKSKEKGINIIEDEDKNISISVINSPKAYNLLTSVMYKRKMMYEELKDSKICH